MPRYIDADMLIQFCENNTEKSVTLNDICRMPTIDPESLRALGKWLTEYEPNGRPYQLHCSVCDSDFSQIGITHASNYCPNCGAKMEVSEDA